MIQKQSQAKNSYDNIIGTYRIRFNTNTKMYKRAGFKPALFCKEASLITIKEDVAVYDNPAALAGERLQELSVARHQLSVALRLSKILTSKKNLKLEFAINLYVHH